ncbi:ABC transporter ATP-binding protein [Mycobacterium sp. KBS0706]|uniref:ABC transporter ATP-binding protein n=1 Tax=Mycobacterium sp. KBS0706 TaxID=2578109 RepID=UPI00110FF5A7|nr:ABC transporter ATP-binding protein [Mycobacterium sp. KBS0706]TSD88623.1 ABC transporter ATP-binding protein [Mycobacterium sp. KBS0706]
MTSPFLSIRGIRKAYGDAVAVEAVSLDIARGEFVTFLGPSGSGKSTTLYVIAGLLEPSAGDVLLDGRSLLTVPSHRRNIGMVFQRYTLFPHLTVAENVAFPLRVRRRPEAEIQAKVKAMLELVRLEPYRDRLPAKLSGGQQQRVALARALAYDPPVLLMDEPLSALDKTLREEIQVEIRRIHRETGVTILYVTHDQEEALRLSDRIALFNHGRIEQVGSGRDLYDSSRTRFAAGFIGNSNFLPGRIAASGGGRAIIVCPDGSRIEGVPLQGLEAGGGEAMLMVRPERMRLERSAGAPGRAGLPGVVVDRTFLGDTMHYTVRTPWNQELAVRSPLAEAGDAEFGFGDAVHVAWDAEQTKLFPGG